jgi:hypothetical protein
MGIERTAKRFSSEVNQFARQAFPALMEKTEIKPLLSSTRLSLRIETPYPYHFTERETLSLDNNKESFGGILFRGRSEGLTEIHTRVTTDTAEHSWLFVPEPSVWIDTTLPHQEDPASVVSDHYLVSFLLAKYPNVELVHTHPDAVIKTLSRENYGYTPDDRCFLEAALPSNPDMISYLQLVSRSNPQATLRSSIVSHYGVTTYEFNETGKKATFYESVDQRRYPFRVSLDPSTQIREAQRELSESIHLSNGKPTFTFAFEQLAF